MIVGIDLGTTNSAVAIWREGKSELIPNSLGHFLTPSAVSIDEQENILVGLAARERQTTHPGDTATIFKRYMGTHRKLSLGSRTYSPEELSSMVVASLKADVEAHTGETVESAVITVPAYFNDKQRRATRRAGELAGLRVERLINEPTAAALAYGLHERDQEEPFLIFDLGGGTFDVSIVEMFDGIIEVRASAGDNHLGGENFNEVLVAYMRKRHEDALPSAGASAALDEIMRDAAERARRALTDGDSAEMRFVWDGADYSEEITADRYEEEASPLITRLRQPVLQSLRDGKTKADELAEIVLVGGSTRMPLVRKAVTRMFGRFPNATVHPDHAVALGAAVQAGLRSRNEDLGEIRLTDVCPFTLGVETTKQDGKGGYRGGVFAPIIERNTVIPVSRVEQFSALHDEQTAVGFNIYQGESRNVEDNVHLGRLEVPVPRGKATQYSIDCRFTYDTSGLLEVDLLVHGTKAARQLLIYDEEDQAHSEDLEARREKLAKLKVHPRDKAENAAALARANRCFEAYLAEKRDYIGDAITRFEAALATQDERKIAPERAQLLQFLDTIEGETWL